MVPSYAQSTVFNCHSAFSRTNTDIDLQQPTFVVEATSKILRLQHTFTASVGKYKKADGKSIREMVAAKKKANRDERFSDKMKRIRAEKKAANKRQGRIERDEIEQTGGSNQGRFVDEEEGYYTALARRQFEERGNRR